MDHVLLPDVGHVRADTPEGDEFTLVPSLANMAAIGTPQEIIEVYSELYGFDPRKVAFAARAVLAACFVAGTNRHGDALPDAEKLIGCTLMKLVENGNHIVVDVPGSMAASEQVALAKHLMTHGLTGKARPGAGGGRGQFSETFSVSDHVAAAVVHLGITKEAALRLTMTEMQLMIEAKYPEAKAKDVPSREEYRKQLAAIMARRAKK